MPWWPVIHDIPDAYRHWRAADVLLRAVGHPGIPGHPGSGDGGHVRDAHAQHPPVGRAHDGDYGLSPHVPGLLHRLIQAPSRVQLGYRF